MNKKNKYHLYLDETPIQKDGYSLTACGREGRNVGGLIKNFFKRVKPSQRCKTCNKIYKLEIITSLQLKGYKL